MCADWGGLDSTRSGTLSLPSNLSWVQGGLVCHGEKVGPHSTPDFSTCFGMGRALPVAQHLDRCTAQQGTWSHDAPEDPAATEGALPSALWTNGWDSNTKVSEHTASASHEKEK